MKSLCKILGVISMLFMTGLYVMKQPVESNSSKNSLKETAVELNKETDKQVQDGVKEKQTQQKTKKESIKIKDTIKEAQKQVSEEDQEKGMNVLSKLDIEFLYSLSQGGFTEEEKQKIKEHIQSRLSKEEINEMMQLYNQYSYLIQ